MPKFTVPITGPDGGAGSITVNASDAQSAVENAAQGGNTPTGGATQVDNGPNAQTSSTNYTAGGSTGGATQNTTATAANPGTVYNYGGSSSGGTAEDRSKAIYEARPGETPQKWMERVFQQGTRDFGGALSPSVDNPYGRTPYAMWFQNRYQDVAAPNLMLKGLLSNNLPVGQDTMAPYVEAGMKDFMNNGAGRGYGTNEGTLGNLGTLNDMMQSYGNKDYSGMSPGQKTMMMSLMDNPDQVLGMINAQFSGGMGANPYASGALQRIGQGLMDEYYDDPVGHDPSKAGSFLNNFMKQINARHY